MTLPFSLSFFFVNEAISFSFLLVFTSAVEDIEGQYQSHRRGHQGEHMMGAAKQSRMGKLLLLV